MVRSNREMKVIGSEVWGRTLNLLKFLNAVSKSDCRWVFAIGGSFGVLNGDPHRARIVETIGRQTECRVAIETGTYLGETTRYLAKCFKHVTTIEHHPRFANIAKFRLEDQENVEMLIGDSAMKFADAIRSLGDKPFFAYLDAHWGSELPLESELKALGGKSDYICMLDDFAVEGTDYGYDEYGGVRIDKSLVRRCAPWIQSVFVPDYPPELSGSERRGYCLFGAGVPGDFLHKEASALQLRLD